MQPATCSKHCLKKMNLVAVLQSELKATVCDCSDSEGLTHGVHSGNGKEGTL